MKKKLAFLTVLMFGLSLSMMACVTTSVKPTTENLKNPVITLESMEIPQYDGYWYYSKGTKTVKGDPDDRGAFLPMSFLFSVQNPNPYPILLEGIQFTVTFDKDFDVVTFNNQDSYWIPAGKTSHVRTTTMITVRSALLSLLVTGGFKLKEKGWTSWDTLERWWKGVPDMTVPVHIKEGAFNFIAGDIDRIVVFEGQVK
jgi:hypothetical protein